MSIWENSKLRILGTLTTIALGIAGVLTPIWLWQADLNSKSVSIRAVTKVSLQPKEKVVLPGVEVTVAGVKLENPHLVVFEIRNDGAKPIVAADFESAGEIRIESESLFVSSRITAQDPKDIAAELRMEGKKLLLKPMLLNPKDTISIAAITSGAAPVFATKFRIAGVSSIFLSDNTNETWTSKRRVLLLVWSFVSLIAATVVYDINLSIKGVKLRRRAAYFVAFVCAFPGIAALAIVLEEAGYSTFWYPLLFVLVLTIPSMLLAMALNRPIKTELNGLVEK